MDKKFQTAFLCLNNLIILKQSCLILKILINHFLGLATNVPFTVISISSATGLSNITGSLIL